MFVHQNSTLQEYFEWVDPTLLYWHVIADNYGKTVMDNLSPDATFHEVLEMDSRVIWIHRREFAPYWSLPEEEPPANLPMEVQDGTTWRSLYGNNSEADC